MCVFFLYYMHKSHIKPVSTFHLCIKYIGKKRKRASEWRWVNESGKNGKHFCCSNINVFKHLSEHVDKNYAYIVQIELINMVFFYSWCEYSMDVRVHCPSISINAFSMLIFFFVSQPNKESDNNKKRKAQNWAAYLTFWLIWPLKVISHMAFTYMWNRIRKWKRIKPAVVMWWQWNEVYYAYKYSTYHMCMCVRLYESIIFKSSQIYILMNFKIRTLSWKSFFQGHQRKILANLPRKKKHIDTFSCTNSACLTVRMCVCVSNNKNKIVFA